MHLNASLWAGDYLHVTSSSRASLKTFQKQLKAFPAAPPFGSWGSTRLLELIISLLEKDLTLLYLWLILTSKIERIKHVGGFKDVLIPHRKP